MRAEQQEFLKKKVEKGTEIGIRDRPVVPQLPPSDQLKVSSNIVGQQKLLCLKVCR